MYSFLSPTFAFSLSLSISAQREETRRPHNYPSIYTPIRTQSFLWNIYLSYLLLRELFSGFCWCFFRCCDLTSVCSKVIRRYLVWGLEVVVEAATGSLVLLLLRLRPPPLRPWRLVLSLISLFYVPMAPRQPLLSR